MTVKVTKSVIQIILLLPSPLLCALPKNLLDTEGSGKVFLGIPGWLNEEGEDIEGKE